MVTSGKQPRSRKQRRLGWRGCVGAGSSPAQRRGVGSLRAAGFAAGGLAPPACQALASLKEKDNRQGRAMGPVRESR